MCVLCPLFDLVPAYRKRIISFCRRESCTTTEIVDGIISRARPSEMRTEPDHASLASLEQHVFACILASCVMHIPAMKYFDYLCAITYSQKSIILGNFLPNSAFTATCHPTSTVPPMIRPRRHTRFSPSGATLSDFVTASPISGKRLSDSSSEFPCRSRWRKVKQVGHTELCYHMDSNSSLTTVRTTRSMIHCSAMTIDSYPIWHRSGMHTTGAKRTCIIVFTSCFPTTSHTSGHGFLLNYAPTKEVR